MFEAQRVRDSGTEKELTATALYPQLPHQPTLDNAEAKSRVLNPGSHMLAGTQCFIHHVLPSRLLINSRRLGLELEAELGLRPGTLMGDASIPRGVFTVALSVYLS